MNKYLYNLLCKRIGVTKLLNEVNLDDAILVIQSCNSKEGLAKFIFHIENKIEDPKENSAVLRSEAANCYINLIKQCGFKDKGTIAIDILEKNKVKRNSEIFSFIEKRVLSLGFLEE